ncbi:MAG: hypothetical protein N2645_23985 [Clostridia bacterium]|nr:hypothetical protein [Clostridia bacterium]
MQLDTSNCLTYVLANGYEKTITLDKEKLFEFLKWFHDGNSNNTYELKEGINEQTTLYKNTILSVRY